MVASPEAEIFLVQSCSADQFKTLTPEDFDNALLSGEDIAHCDPKGVFADGVKLLLDAL